jgi:hypothetical protein
MDEEYFDIGSWINEYDRKQQAEHEQVRDPVVERELRQEIQDSLRDQAVLLEWVCNFFRLHYGEANKLSQHLGVSKSYVSMLLAGKRVGVKLKGKRIAAMLIAHATRYRDPRPDLKNSFTLYVRGVQIGIVSRSTVDQLLLVGGFNVAQVGDLVQRLQEGELDRLIEPGAVAAWEVRYSEEGRPTSALDREGRD